MIAILVAIQLGGAIHERPMRNMKFCEIAARVYNESRQALHYCAWAGSGFYVNR